jgi:hypothetical protein
VRVKKIHAEYPKMAIKDYLPDAAVYLIGSRTNDKLRGGISISFPTSLISSHQPIISIDT